MAEYKVPQKFASMTVNHFYGLSETGKHADVMAYLKEYGFALTADLIVQGFKASDIEEAVNSGEVRAAHWPAAKPASDMYWAQDEKTLKRLEELADEAVRFCYGNDPDQPFGGDFASVGAEMGNQQTALVGLIYAREQGRLIEIPEFDRGAGPLYIVKGNLFERMLKETVVKIFERVKE